VNNIDRVIGLPAEKYHATQALSKSGLDQFLRSPAHFKAWQDGIATVEQTPAMAFGSAFHCAMLEPYDFAKRYAVFTGDRRTKDGKAQYESLMATGVTLLNQEQKDAIESMKLSIQSHPAASKMFQGAADTEVSCFGTFDGVKVKARIDLVPDHREVFDSLVDIKTTQDASPVSFAKTAAQLRYHVQAAWYLRFFPNKTRFIFIAIEKTAPFECAVYEMDDAAIAQGNAEIDKQLELYRSCQEFNSWPGYSTAIQKLTLPNWAFKTTNE
jgi:hypothetical protein